MNYHPNHLEVKGVVLRDVENMLAVISECVSLRVILKLIFGSTSRAKIDNEYQYQQHPFL